MSLGASVFMTVGIPLLRSPVVPVQYDAGSLRYPYTMLFPEIRRAVTQWDSLQIPFLTFEIFAQVFLKCVLTSSICSEGKKREKRKKAAL